MSKPMIIPAQPSTWLVTVALSGGDDPLPLIDVQPVQYWSVYNHDGDTCWLPMTLTPWGPSIAEEPGVVVMDIADVEHAVVQHAEEMDECFCEEHAGSAVILRARLNAGEAAVSPQLLRQFAAAGVVPPAGWQAWTDQEVK